MDRIVECVPNFSEGRDPATVEKLVNAICSVPGVFLLDQTMDADHHRSVITFAGAPEAVLEAAISAAHRAVEVIDLNFHVGVHPRMGALDVLPFVPIKGVTMADCVALARRAGESIARELGIPVYLYEHAAMRPDRTDLADVRKGGFETLREEIGVVPARRPDYGEARIHPTAGAVAIGARQPLVAWNINLATENLEIAKKIARAIRGRDGGLRYVKALGLELNGRGQTQVSMNLVNYEATPLHRVFEMVRREAQRYGVLIAGSEIIGLIPQAALDASADYFLQFENFHPRLVLENRLRAEIETGAAQLWNQSEETEEEETFGNFALHVAADKAAPGGASVAAYTGVLAVSLGCKVCRLTIGSSEKTHLQAEANDILIELERLEEELQRAQTEERENLDRLLDARDLATETEAEQLARGVAIEQAARVSVTTLSRMAEIFMESLELLDELCAISRYDVMADLLAATQFALSGMRGAGYHILDRLKALRDDEFIRQQRAGMDDLLIRAQEIADSIEEQFMKQHL